MTSAAELLKIVGLRADGPVRWGATVRSGKPGIFIVEIGEPVTHAPIDASICGKWAERVTTLLLDGERPDGRQLARRLASFWIPSQTVLYVASTERSLGARIGALYATELGSRRPHSGGHWLKTLRGLELTRIWWAETGAVEEYEDAVLGAFADVILPDEVATLHDPSVVLPFAILQTPLGERKAHGLTGSLLVAGEPAPTAIARSVRPAARQPASPRRTAAPRRVPAGTSTGGLGGKRGTGTTGAAGTGQDRPAPVPTYMSSTGLERLEAELAELHNVQRPAVVLRIKAARELGDLRENADYDAARREQSFIEGRVQAIEAILRTARVVDQTTTHEVIIGSVVTLEREGETIEYTIVGSSEANPRLGRVSYLSPLGKALLGRHAGDDVVVQAPSGERHYRIADAR